MKKVFIISSILLVVVIIFLVIYNFAFNDRSPKKEKSKKVTQSQAARVPANEAKEKDSVQDNRSSGDTNVNKRVNEKIIPVTKRKVIAPVVDDSQDRIRFYEMGTGKVFDVSILGGTERVFSDVSLADFVYAAWSPDTNRVLTKFVNQSGTRIFLFDHRTSRGTQLKRGIERVEWTAVGDKILYTYYDERSKRTSLNLADADGSNWKVLADRVPRGAHFINVPDSSRVAYWQAPNKSIKSDLKILSLVDRSANAKTIFKGQYNADYLFAPDGQKILISSTTKKGSNARTLGIANANGGEYQNLQIPTNVDKCVWATNSRTIYCAFPTGDRDTFWKIDVTTNQKERMLDLDGVLASSTRYQAFDLFLAPDGRSLFFTNRIDDRLYRISL